MPAESLLNERHVLDEETFVEIVVWRVPSPVKGSRHRLKYRMALVSNGICILRYDNEAGKGDHRHIAGRQEVYVFSDPERLLEDFWSDVENWRKR
jgi:hypothetical protein